MKMSRGHREDLITHTREAAAALVEDLQHIREGLEHANPAGHFIPSKYCLTHCLSLDPFHLHYHRQNPNQDRYYYNCRRLLPQ